MADPSPIRSVLICGYGVMGRGVAGTFAENGFTTTVLSRRADELHELPSGVEAVKEPPEAPPDLIIEFAPEDVPTKQAVYRELEAAYPSDDVLIATGTSGLDLVELAEGMSHPKRFLGVHYFFPADTTPMAEVMAGPATPAAWVDRTAEALARSGKRTISLYKPIAGFLINRLQHAILHETYYLIENGVASAEEIDRAAIEMLGPRMCLTGITQQKDISGLTIHGLAQRSIVPRLYHNNEPNPMLQGMIERGEDGLGAGKGFYDWQGCDPEVVRRESAERLTTLLDYLKSGIDPRNPDNVPTPRDLDSLKAG